MEQLNYDHLDTAIAKSRYAMAANFLNDCETIVEVGGTRNCSMDHFIQCHNPVVSDTRQIIVIGNDLHNYSDIGDGITHCNFPVEEYDFHNELSTVTGKCGLCIMGMELYPSKPITDPMYAITSNMHLFSRIVIDYVVTNQRALSQAIEINSVAVNLRFHLSIDLTHSWTYDHKYFTMKKAMGEEINPSFFKERRFMVYDL